MKRFFVRLGWKRIAIICILSVMLVLVLASTVLAGEPTPTVAENIETAFSGAGDSLNEVVYKIVPIVIPVMIAITGFMLAFKIIKRVVH